ncbi:histidine phosphatase family protein [Roseivivax sp. THAF30]|uniref:SixA phosphatase family protein n=1 Tax=Roseivivax sp. THAF30 TaxID=2587852 RepID=UPI0012690027|nr:histidine phosphatase family protein [Roseivivax sp. THAF30]QFT64603.1 Histidine phosphatase superfamily (branch 1) [Roseivivax sp. THAF30]
MRRLILMRHAKSDWHQGLEDHERPLNKRGRASCTALAAWLRETGLTPDAALLSSSMRTVETFGRLDLDCEVRTTRALYLAEPDEIVAELREETAETVLLIGHNPGIGITAGDLVAEAPSHSRFADYPTGATLVAEFDIDAWSELTLGTGRVVHFAIPRELPGME